MSAAVTVANPADVKSNGAAAVTAPAAVPDAIAKFKAADVKPGAKEGLVTIDGKTLVPYYAIGSMMNIVSMNLRELFPYRSTAGELKGYELVFLGMNGMASVNAKEGASTHGVLHYISEKEMEALDKIEASYARLWVDIHLYDGSVVKGFVYQMDHKRFPAMTAGVQNPPSERYIDIITRGAKYHGVNGAFIEWLNKLPVVPRRKPSEFKPIPDPDGVFQKVKVTCAQLKAMDGNEGRDLGVCINRKVMRFAGDIKTPGGLSSYNWAKGRFSGKDNTVALSHTLYEPMYPIVKRFCDMSPEQRAWCEDFYSNNWTGMWQAVGTLCDMPDDA